MANKNVNIKIKSDSKDAENGIKKVTSDLNKLSKTVNSSDFAKLTKSVAGVGVAFAAVTKTVQKVNQTVKETTELYRKQINAEKQLEIAAKNNPYLNSSSVKALKDYASYLQSVSTVGDEELLPMMAQLASAGRTQEEIQNIMSAALDVSASGFMSLDSAVTALNKTYSGNVGLLGNQISGLKTLTSEQLKNGDAVKIIADKFKGMAEETAKATGSAEQLKNAIGDFKEELGAGFEKALAPMRTYFTTLIQGWTDAKKAKREYKELSQGIVNGTADATEENIKLYQEQVTTLQTEANKLEHQIRSNAELMGQDPASELNASVEYQRKLEDLRKARENLANANLKLAESQNELNIAEENSTTETTTKTKSKDELALEFMNKNQKALDRTIERLYLEAELKGEEVDQQEILNAMMQSYIDLVTSGDLVTENNPFSKKRLEEIQSYAESLEDANNKLNNVEQSNEDLIESQNKVELTTKEMMSALDGYLTQLSSMALTINDIFSKQLTESIEKESTLLKKQYDEGIISYEDFLAKKEKLDKEAAEKSYQLQMWNWTAQMLEAAANTAIGITQALSEVNSTTAMKIVNAGIIATSGAVQMAAIANNKPQMPAFANGGIVGASVGPDNTIASVRSGEMVINAAQQKQLWNMANGKGGTSSIVMPVNIQNNSNAQVSAELTADGLQVLIDATVQSSLQKGKYNQSLQIARNKMNGVKIL